MWFKKNKKDNEKLQKLEKSLIEANSSLKSYNRECNSLKEELAKLKRTVKYSKDEPTFNIVSWCDYDSSWNGIYTIRLYIYVEKEEYEIHLKEFNHNIKNKDVTNFRIENGLVYLDIEHHVHSADWDVYKYIIDYREGTYVYSIEEETRITNS